MKRIAQLAAGALLLAGAANVAAAQDDPTVSSGPFLKPPVFLLMPGVLQTNVISKPEGTETGDAMFNARFMTVIPTSSPYFTLLGGAQWGAASEDDHGPIIFYGAIIPIPGITEATQGWLTLSIDPLGVTTGAGGEGTNFFLEGAAVLNIGAKMMTNSPFKGLGLYFLLDQQITRIPEDANGDKDRFNPVMLYGLALPIAPWGP